MAEGIGEGISNLYLSKDERSGGDVGAITHGISKMSTQIKADVKEVGSKGESHPIKPAAAAAGNRLIKFRPGMRKKKLGKVEIVLQPIAMSWKKNGKAFPTFQGGEASSPFFYTWSDLNLQRLMQDHDYFLKRQYFFPEYDFHLQVDLNTRGARGYLFLGLRFIGKSIRNEEETKTKEPVECEPLLPCIYLVMKTGKGPHLLLRSFQRNYEEVYEYDEGYHHSIYFGKVERSFERNKDGWADLKIYVEQPSMSTRSYSHSGFLVWSVDEYERSKERHKMELSEGELSPYFYTDPRGYRVQAVVTLYKLESWMEKDVCVRINFLNGMYDDWLTGYYEHRTTVSVVKKDAPRVKMSKSVVRNLHDGHNTYVVQLGSYEEVEKYIEKDTLCYTVLIEGLSTGEKRKLDAAAGESQNDAAGKK